MSNFINSSTTEINGGIEKILEASEPHNCFHFNSKDKNNIVIDINILKKIYIICMAYKKKILGTKEMNNSKIKILKFYNKCHNLMKNL